MNQVSGEHPKTQVGIDTNKFQFFYSDFTKQVGMVSKNKSLPLDIQRDIMKYGGVNYTPVFERCVKKVKTSVTPRKGSSKESAAIAICTKTVLYKRGRTIKRYRKGHLKTQKRRK